MSKALLDLATRVEGLRGPCRETDIAIYRLIYPFPAVGLSDAAQDRFDLERAPAYTASLDAAMTLVPPNHQFYVDSGTSDLAVGCHACVWDQQNKRNSGGAKETATPALALTAASLRAIAAALKSAEPSHGR